MQYLRQSTASQVIYLEYYDETDGITPETGLTIANTDIDLFKEGATSATAKNIGGATHIAEGQYYATLDATDTNTLGKLTIKANMTGAIQVRSNEFMVLPANVYDSLVLGTDYLQTDVIQVGGATEDIATETKQDIIDGIVDAILLDTAEIGAAGAGLTAIPWNTAWDAEVESEVTDALNAYDPPTNTEMTAAFTEIKGATWSSLTDTLEHIRDKQTDIEADTAEIGSAGAGLTAVPWNAAWDAEVESEVTDALNTYDPPTNTEMTAAFTEIKGATWSAASDTLEHIRDKQTDIEADTNELQSDWANGGRLDLIIDELTAQGDTNQSKIDVIDGIVDAILLDTAEIGAAGAGLTAVPWNASWDAEVQSEVADALAVYDPPTNAEMEARTPTAAQLAYIVANAALGVPVTFNGTGTTTTGTFATVDGTTPSSVDNVFNDRVLIFDNGEVVRITDYNGTTKVVTVSASVEAVGSGRTARLL